MDLDRAQQILAERDASGAPPELRRLETHRGNLARLLGVDGDERSE